jgi:hypothetical protein
MAAIVTEDKGTTQAGNFALATTLLKHPQYIPIISKHQNFSYNQLNQIRN